jgi:DNA-binding transcriptional MocR family regulator
VLIATALSMGWPLVMGLRPGDVVAVDALTYPGFKAAGGTVSAGAALRFPSAMTAPISMLARLCRMRHLRAVYTMPTLHNPLGWVLNARQGGGWHPSPVSTTCW